MSLGVKDACLFTVSGNPGTGAVTLTAPGASGASTLLLPMAAGDDGKVFNITIYAIDANGNALTGTSALIEVQKRSTFTWNSGTNSTFSRTNGNVVNGSSGAGTLVNFTGVATGYRVEVSVWSSDLATGFSAAGASSGPGSVPDPGSSSHSPAYALGEDNAFHDASTLLPSTSVTYAKIQNISATSKVLGRKTAGAGATEEIALTDLLDFIGSVAQGDILVRGASVWARLPYPNDATKVLDGTGAYSFTSAIRKTINQTAHGFSVGNALLYNGSAYVLAKADSAANAEVVGIVSAIVDVNNFILIVGGYVPGLSGLTAGTVYFLSPTSSGAITATPPSTVGQVSKPLLIADTTTSGWYFNFRGVVIGSDDTVTINTTAPLAGGGAVSLGGSITLSLTTPLTVDKGGTGLATLTTHSLQVGAGTANIVQVGPSSTTDAPLVSGGSSADPLFRATQIKIDSHYGAINDNGNSGTGTVTMDLSVSDKQQIELTGTCTLALSNAKTGQVFMVRLVQGSGPYTVTWFTTIKWAGGTAPTLTVTNGKVDTFSFLCTGAGTYDGFVVGQNI